MYKHLYTRIFYGTAIAILLYLDFTIAIPWYSYLILYFSYLLTAFWGTYFMQLNYFLFSYCNGPRDKKEIAITFDDGPMPGHTEKILDILKTNQTPAAFFVIGKNIPSNENLLKRIVNEGHIIGNHSYDHGFFFSLKRKKIISADMRRCNREIALIAGVTPNMFRPPYGVTNPWIAKVIKRMGFASIGWSVRTYDTMAKDREELLTKTLTRLKNGDVVLFHDWGKFTAEILPEFISGAQKSGFSIVRLDTLLGVSAYKS